MSDVVAVVLAAGKGTRMKSALPKVLHKVGGKPMVQHVLDAAKVAGAEKSVVVIGFGAESVKETIGKQAEFALQTQQLGTGHAVMQVEPILKEYQGTILVLCGDTPLLDGSTLKAFVKEHQARKATATVLTAKMPNPKGYGRVVRDSKGNVMKIVEQRDADAEEDAINEVNTGIYCFESQSLFKTIEQINCDNAQGEYYLTDVIGILAKQKMAKVWAVIADDYKQTLGINSRVQLAEAEKILRLQKLRKLMDDGVTIMDPNSTFVDNEVIVGKDTTIYPFTWLEGKCIIGDNCEIGPNTRLTNVIIRDNSKLSFTYAHDMLVEEDVTVGPYVHLRPNTVLSRGVKVGNFVEIKNSNIGEMSKVPHLSYIGDTDMGEGVNIGSGTITVNYDGVHKHRTTIEDGAFVGCNTNLVAPVTVGQGAYVAAGSTITKDVPADALGVARARQNNLEGWVKRCKK